MEEISIDKSSPQEEFIFQESEFEEVSFDAQQFVSKYRRVTSLESLRHQLRQCADGLKNQLYAIINKDYKDFINIATKLDGVDTRIDFLRKPLVDVRLDLAALHDGLVASVQSIQDKLRRKADVSSRRLLLETILACTEKLDIVESLVGDDRDKAKDPASTDNSKMARRQLLRYVEEDSGKLLIFKCSELERAAYAIDQVEELLDKINTRVTGTDPATTGPSSRPSNLISPVSGLSSNRHKELEVIHRTLHQRSMQLMNALADDIRKHISKMFSSKGSGSDDQSASNAFPSTAFKHCVRALIVLKRTDILESVFDQIIVNPMIKSLLTQGRVDGTGGRGSFAGLEETLLELSSQLKSVLQEPLKIIEEQRYAAIIDQKFDIIINGIWKPIAGLLSTRFPSMFTIAIADTFARCYLACDLFKSSLTTLAGDDWTNEIINRFSTNATIREMDSKWQTDVYYHLRNQEICNGIDKVCEAALLGGIIKNVFDGSIVFHRSILTQSSLSPLEKLTEIYSEVGIGSYHLHFIKYFATEIAFCMNPRIMLRPLRGRFLTLCLSLIHRLEAHICMSCDIITSRFSKQALNALHSQLLTSSSSSSMESSDSAANPSTTLATPIKKPSNTNLSGSSTPSAAIPAYPVTPSTPGGKANAATIVPLTVDEMVMLYIDVTTLFRWLTTSLTAYAVKQLTHELNYREETNSLDSDRSKIVSLIKSHAESLLSLSSSIWTKTSSIIGNECKKNLGGVRVIAGKYRMTNKPPPDAPSPYVETILQPLRVFRDKHNDEVRGILPEASQTWLHDVVEDITSYFCQQVQSLMETVKQMDSALQRRTKARPMANVPSSNAIGAMTSGSMSDSEKISMQVALDVVAYGQDMIALLDVKDTSVVSSYVHLIACVEEAKQVMKEANASNPSNAAV